MQDRALPVKIQCINEISVSGSFGEGVVRGCRVDLSAGESGAQFCYGLRDQIGVLADGTLVPCCLDHEGDVPLGNLFAQPLEEILSSPRACAIREGFSRRIPAEDLCRRCGFAARFNK